MPKLSNRSYHLFFFFMSLYLLMPWAYFDEAVYKLNFLPKYLFLGFLTLSTSYMRLDSWIRNWKKYFVLAFFSILLFFFCYLRYNFCEVQYFLQVLYFEIAIVCISSPSYIRKKYQNTLYLFLIFAIVKSFYFRTGNYIHGGYFSSNLFATFIGLCLLSLFSLKGRVKFFFLLTGLTLVLLIGSKTIYLSLFLLMVYFVLTGRNKNLDGVINNFFCNMKSVLIFSFFISVILGLSLTQTNFFKEWEREIRPSKDKITANIMSRRGISVRSIGENKRDYLKKKTELTSEFAITPPSISIQLRLIQYREFLRHIPSFLFMGDIKMIASESFGHNPHSAVMDLISRLGLAYFILLLIFYNRLFTFFVDKRFLFFIFPILLFQPYGYVLGHGLIAFSFFYIMLNKYDRYS